MTVLRCPVCRADNSQGTTCRRCKADLSALFSLEAARERLLDDACRHASAGQWRQFAVAVRRAHELRSDAQTRMLRAVGELLAGERVAALRWALAAREKKA